jgi:hypothetical protein
MSAGNGGSASQTGGEDQLILNLKLKNFSGLFGALCYIPAPLKR